MELEVTGVLIADQDGGYTAYLKEFPAVIAEGDSKDEATTNLFEALVSILEYQRSEMVESDFVPGATFEKFKLTAHPAHA